MNLRLFCKNTSAVYHAHFKKCTASVSRVQNQNGVSGLYYMLEIYHSGLEPLILGQKFCLFFFLFLSPLLLMHHWFFLTDALKTILEKQLKLLLMWYICWKWAPRKLTTQKSPGPSGTLMALLKMQFTMEGQESTSSTQEAKKTKLASLPAYTPQTIKLKQKALKTAAAHIAVSTHASPMLSSLRTPCPSCRPPVK